MQFKIEPRMKKSFFEQQTFKKDNFLATLETGWRWGSLWVTLQEDEYLPSQFDIFDSEDFEEWEIDSAWDSCWEDWSVTYCGVPNSSDKLQDIKRQCSELTKQLESEYSEHGLESIENSGWEQDSYNVYIHNEWRITDVERSKGVEV
jgi:hypothetical protein|tara:strand:- start:1763 stop:2203 length:441 start_codon:yes stop_codon:yes gene_type:complete